MPENHQQRIPKNPGIPTDVMKYAKQGITLLAAQLANEDAIDDYWLVSTPASVDYFGHVIAIITDSNRNQHVLLVETKLNTSKTMRLVTDPRTERDSDKYDVPLHKYLQTYEKIIGLDVGNELKEKLEGIPRENFYFCLFTNMSRNILVQRELKEFVDAKLDLNTSGKSILNCFGTYAKSPMNLLPKEYEKFLGQFYIFAEQPNTQTVYKELEEHIGKSTNGTIDILCDAIESTMKEDEYCTPLTKIGFFEKCLEVQLSDVILF